ncbi:ATP-binding protein [Marinisporobacter balticus]|uniref:histidine kinase n=1 Tax=Marinisporobacter balticus TaxID=2018667 RepID=A0A4R2L2F8_9FIRM|nr:ATP-binding protein [Marinisporobacter balticus]TCO79397.1 two-component system sensor histidine kinase YcbA [Marinisporobacter balticus]
MKNFKKMVIVSVVVAFASQISVNLFVSDFKISFAVILFPIFLYIFRDLYVIPTGILAGGMVYLGRIVSDGIVNGVYSEAILIYFPDVFFYGFYGIFYSILSKKNSIFNENKLFFIMVICDYLSNMIEIYMRMKDALFISFMKIASILLLVAIVRASIVWMVFNGMNYYKMFILKKEHEKRYRKLLWLTSRLKTEMYWMEKSMDHIEKVMSNAYALFEKISLEKDRDSWADLSVTIAKDVHEIKKEYHLFFCGVEEIIENKLKDEGMYFQDIIIILRESMFNEMKYRRKEIDFSYQIGKNFYTEKHYYLMSVLRNMIMNAMDAIDASERKAQISFRHDENEKEHIFRIADTGCGIKDEDLKYIFSPGFSTKIDYTTGYINRGLGLSLVKDIVEKQFNGKIKVCSIEGRGSEFEIYISKELLEVSEK